MAVHLRKFVSLNLTSIFLKNEGCLVPKKDINIRTLSQSQHSLPNEVKKEEADKKDKKEDADKKDGWLSSFFVRRIDPGHESHSSKLSDKDCLFEMQVHSVKPDKMEKYLKLTGEFVDRMHNKKDAAELIGSWTVEIGDQDEAIHIWKYTGGYTHLNRATEMYRNDSGFSEFRKERNTMLRERKNQIMLAFSYWGGIKQRPGSNIYELRSYVLKPGTMIEWGNYWAKGITYRQEYDEATAGFFAHIGELYVVHHLWAYENLETRQEVRDYVWHKPGWDVCVQHTVPLIRHMTSRILVPTPFSPLK